MPAGRPCLKIPEVIQKLKDAFMMGLTVEGACGYAKIHRATFYVWLKKDTEFRDMVELFTSQGMTRLEVTALKGAEKDPRLALSILGRRRREWQEKQKTELEGMPKVIEVIIKRRGDYSKDASD